MIDWGGYTWHVYEGSGLLGQLWAADNVRVNKKGRLVIKVADGVGGGVSLAGQDQEYGTWKVRFRMSAGEGSKYVILLWPQDGPRPEIDFAEGSQSDPNRTYTTATYHQSMDPAGNSRWLSPPTDFTKWHTAEVMWDPGTVSVSTDGIQWGFWDYVPDVPMHLAIQAASFAPGPPTRLQIDSVEIEPLSYDPTEYERR